MGQFQNRHSRARPATRLMTKQTKIALAAAILALSVGGIFAYHKWGVPSGSSRQEILAMMPSDAAAVLYIELNELRQSPFVAQLYSWAPSPQTDADYAQFVRDSGFDYERDLTCISVALQKRGQESILFAVAEGKFDRQKLAAFALKDGSIAKTGGREIFSVPVNGSTRKVSFTFLGNRRIAFTNDSSLADFLDAKKRPADAAEWHQRFERLGGSPAFAVIRQDAALGATLSARAPGGLRSPQLSSLLGQLQWITLAGKPDNDRLRVVAEGESSESTVRQLADVLNGVLILAEGGLNDAKMKQQLDPEMRAAYLELLKSADVSKIDRGDSKSVRLVFDLTPGFLEAARKAPVAPPEAAPAKPLPKKAPASRNGHT